MSRDFDGTTGYLEFPGPTITAFPLTMACWMNNDDITAGQALVSLSTSGGTARLQLTASGATVGDPTSANSVTAGGVSVSANSATGYSASTWHHCAATFVSTTSRTGWIDGAAGTTSTTANDPSIASLNRLVIGARISAGAYGAFANGRIAEVAIWNEELAATEIAALARGHSPPSMRPQALVAYFPLRLRLSVVPDMKNNYNLVRTGSVLDGGHPRIIRRESTARIFSFPIAAAGGAVGPLIHSRLIHRGILQSRLTA